MASFNAVLEELGPQCLGYLLMDADSNLLSTSGDLPAPVSAQILSAASKAAAAEAEEASSFDQSAGPERLVNKTIAVQFDRSRKLLIRQSEQFTLAVLVLDKQQTEQ